MKLIDIQWAYRNTHLMPGDLIILNGPSSVGKSSLVEELQQLWPRPLLARGIDSIITGWPEKFVLDHDESDPAKEEESIHIVAGLGPAPSWVPKMSDTFLTISRHAHESWAAIHQSGIDVVVDHCIIEPDIREQAQSLLLGAFWVGVTCDVEELVRREAARGDRYTGFASGTSAVVHRGMDYDLMIDTTSTPPEELARQVFDAVRHR
jgi:chloramphenicol 3-O phosphotransferase